VVIVFLVGLLNVNDWYVWHRQHAATANTATTATQTDKAPVAKKEAVIPKGYAVYDATDYGFSYAYPDEWGEFKGANQGYLLGTYPVGNIPFGEQSMLSDSHGFTVSKIGDFRPSTGKYGASLQPVKQGAGYIWKVVEVNPADANDKIGNTYAVKSFQSSGGVMIYDFTWADEGAVHGLIAFVAGNNFVSIGIPYIWTPIPGKEGGYKDVPANDVVAYHKLVKTVADTVTVR